MKRLNVFERYLTLWVGLCMLAGVAGVLVEVPVRAGRPRPALVRNPAKPDQGVAQP